MSKQFNLTEFNTKSKEEESKKELESNKDKFTFIEMFSGIGGFRLGLERSGWRCVWVNEIDKYASKIYKIHFGFGELDEGDIRKKEAERIPRHTMLTAGFPCQSFSVAGKGKGFEDTRGTLFYEICRIAKAKKPKLLFLENVRGLLSNNKGKTFLKILQSLDELGYDAEWQVLNSKYYGVPQSRQRVFIIGHLRGECTRTIFPIGETNILDEGKNRRETSKMESATIDASYWKGPDGKRTMIAEPKEIAYCLDANYYKGAKRQRTYVKTIGSENPTVRCKGRGSLDKHAWDTIMVKGMTLANTSRYKQGVNRTPKKEDDTSFALGTSGDQGVAIKKIIDMHSKHKSQVGRIYDSLGLSPVIKTPSGGQNIPMIIADRTRTKAGKGRNLESPKEIANSLTNATKDNYLMNEMRIRRLTPTECERLQGFPDGWTKWLSDTQRYKCLGNAVTVNVIEYLGKLLKECLK